MVYDSGFQQQSAFPHNLFKEMSQGLAVYYSKTAISLLFLILLKSDQISFLNLVEVRTRKGKVTAESQLNYDHLQLLRMQPL